MKPMLQHLRRGFTLLELSIAIMIGMATGGLVITLFNQQLTFLSIFKTQNFLVEEAPIINSYVSRLVGKADRFRLHADFREANAVTVTNPSLGPSSVLVLKFRQPNGTMTTGILAFEDLNDGNGPVLNYYLNPTPGAVTAVPTWTVTKLRAPGNISFSVVLGVLRMTITGPNNEQIVYSGTMQQ